jgi:hypothetical protein
MDAGRTALSVARTANEGTRHEGARTMHRTAIRPLIAAALIALLVGVALTATGCGSAPEAKKKLTPIPVTTPTVETTASAAADAAANAASAGVSSGPISTLNADSAVTSSLANAARTYLKSTSKFTINQLFRQGDVVVGDITPKAGGARIFIAWVGPTWKVAWTAAMGQGGSTIARAAVPQMSKELAAKMNWSPKVAAASSGSGSTSDTTALVISFGAFAKAKMLQLAPDAGDITISDVRVVKDNSGVWWASGLADATYGDPVTFFGKYVGGKWVDMGNSSDGVESTDPKFPQEVQGSL